jgi:hypothetical protein
MPLTLADPSVPLAEHWRQHEFGSKTHYRNLTKDGVPAIEAMTRMGASGLFRKVDWDVASQPILEWRWRVDELQGSADIRVKDLDDHAAALVLRFGGESIFSWMDPVLVYVWTNDRVSADQVVHSPRTDKVRAVVLRSGEADLGRWVAERRDVLADFQRAFGRLPRSPVTRIGIWSDADQTGEAVLAYYAAVRAQSAGLPHTP